VMTNGFFVLKGAVELKSPYLVTKAIDGAMLGNIGLFPDHDAETEEVSYSVCGGLHHMNNME
jgi:hypothetical protein